jgi:hypothetical protein
MMLFTAWKAVAFCLRPRVLMRMNLDLSQRDVGKYQIVHQTQ